MGYHRVHIQSEPLERPPRGIVPHLLDLPALRATVSTRTLSCPPSSAATSYHDPQAHPHGALMNVLQGVALQGSRDYRAKLALIRICCAVGSTEDPL